MEYIILDMEWNQPWPGSYAAQRPLPIHISGEVIQIGAVRMTEDQRILDEFQVLIKPKFFRRLNSRVAKLTGIRESRLKAEGLSFDDAINEFYNWCGEDCVFLTWGFDDIPLLSANMMLNGYDPVWVQHWYNAQMIFNAQTGSGNNQKALSTAMEMLEIPATRQAHDALGDAFHTAQICAKLDLKKGIAEYRGSLQEHEDGLHGAQVPGCVSRRVYHDYEDKTAAMGDMGGKENLCPVCGREMTCQGWHTQPGRRYLSRNTCPDHGDYIVRIRFERDADGSLKVCRLVYDSSSALAENFDAEIAKKAKKRPRRRRKRLKAEL